MKPDLTFFIDANAETIQSRSNYGEERYERVEFQKKVSEAYGRFKEESRGDDHWVTVNADGKGINDLHAEILEKVVRYMEDEVEKHDIAKMATSLFIESPSTTTQQQ